MKRVVVVGVGALGSHLVLLGRNWDVQWTVIDFDRVEHKNTLSQFHSRMGIGKNKAQALQQAMQGLFGVRLNAVPHRLGPDNAATLLSDCDLVLDCVDNAETRVLIANQVRKGDVPCLHGAVAADGSYARIMWDEHFSPDEGGEGQATCEDGEHLPFLMTVSARMAHTVQRYLADGTRSSEHLHPGGIIKIG